MQYNAPASNTMLKYLFFVEYQDGTTFQQNAEDVSMTDPKRSAFFDIKQENVRRFSLEGDGQKYTVDLLDGHFEVNGASFMLHDYVLLLHDMRLVFFRQHDHTWPTKEHRIVYCLGWQANDENGKKNQRLIRIN